MKIHGNGNLAPEEVPEEMLKLRSLVTPYGLVSHTTKVPPRSGEPNFNVYLARIGSPSRALNNLDFVDEREDTGNSDGAGTGLNPRRAEMLAIAEALERYSVASWHNSDITIASEANLTEEYISPERWARCSPEELAKPGSHLRAYDPSKPIRWVKAWSLTRQIPVYVPAIAVYLHMPYFSESEKFTRGITTGAAVHSNLNKAVLSGLLEVIERDSIALTWLQQLPHPEIRVDVEKLNPLTRAYHSRGTQNSPLKTRFFDATTDFGVPVIYAVQLSDNDTALAQIVAATCDLSPQTALAKLYRELASIRIALAGSAQLDASVQPDHSKVSVIGGAVFNASMKRRKVFDFLLENETPTIDLQEMPDLSKDEDPLAKLTGTLADKGAEVLVVDITTDEARQVGMHAVKVLVPEAQPVSFIHSERFLGNPRLYEAPARMGYPSKSERNLNPELQPFA